MEPNGQNSQQNDLGVQIKASVEAAVSSINHMVVDIKDATRAGDTSQLGQTVNSSVRRAVDEIRNQFYTSYQATQNVYQQQNRQFRENRRTTLQPVRIRRRPKKFPGEVNNQARIGWMSLLLGFMLIFWMASGTFFGFLGTVVSSCFLYKSVRKRRQYRRFRQYIQRFASQPFYRVTDIMAAFGYSKKTVLKDWREMIRLGIFPQASISPDNNIIFLSASAFVEYQSQLMQSYIGPSAALPQQRMQNMPQQQQQQMQQTQQIRQPAQQQSQAGQEKMTLSPDVEAALQQGKEYILQIRNANDAIPGEAVSQKLHSLEDVCKRIFRVVEEHPEKLPEIRKFMEYYMPTTLKLVKTYREFDEQKLEGERITQTKRDIEDTLDMINIAFENLLNDLFQSAAIEASADISVLQTLFAQEGLKEKEFIVK